jgi:hypothetical protein
MQDISPAKMAVRLRDTIAPSQPSDFHRERLVCSRCGSRAIDMVLAARSRVAMRLRLVDQL